MTGRTKNFNRIKFYGYIRAEDGKEYFFHRADFDGDYDALVFNHYKFEVGVPVTFQPSMTEKGIRARNVSLL